MPTLMTLDEVVGFIGGLGNRAAAIETLLEANNYLIEQKFGPNPEQEHDDWYLRRQVLGDLILLDARFNGYKNLSTGDKSMTYAQYLDIRAELLNKIGILA